MATPGQPTLYKPEYRELAHNDYLLRAERPETSRSGLLALPARIVIGCGSKRPCCPCR